MDNYTEQVLEFHQAFKLHTMTRSKPGIPMASVSLLRVQCLIEEVGELAHALGNCNQPEVLDALVDIQYFLSGTVLACGMQDVFEPAFAEVHATNMAKLDANGNPIRDASGRVVKPAGWVAPDLKKFVERCDD